MPQREGRAAARQTRPRRSGPQSQFIAELRRLSEGKPVGFKLCIGHPWEFLALVKAMIETDVTPDFIVIDGTEGGTGAAPLEFLDHIGMPL
jgi:glutamate synthase domain-containing protein 2